MWPGATAQLQGLVIGLYSVTKFLASQMAIRELQTLRSSHMAPWDYARCLPCLVLPPSFRDKELHTAPLN